MEKSKNFVSKKFIADEYNPNQSIYTSRYKKEPKLYVLAPFGTLERTRTSGLPLRRRLRYPLRYQGLCAIFNFFAIFGGYSYSRLGGGRSILLSYGRKLPLQRTYCVIVAQNGRTVNEKSADCPGKVTDCPKGIDREQEGRLYWG